MPCHLLTVITFQCIVIFCFFAMASVADDRAAVAVQLIERNSTIEAEEVRKLNASKLEVATMVSQCPAVIYLGNQRQNISASMIANVTLDAGSLHAASVVESISSGGNREAMLQLNMSFPMEPDTFSGIRSGLTGNLVSLHFKAFAVNNFTQGYCGVPRCPVDDMCVEKMSLADVESSIKRWKKASTNWRPACQMGSILIHEGTGFMKNIGFLLIGKQLMLNATISLADWSNDLPAQLFKGFSNINVTLAGISLVLTYQKSKPGSNVNWFQSTEGLVNLTLMGILGFNFLVIIFALLFCACNRSKRAFEREIWDYASSRKNVDKDEEPW